MTRSAVQSPASIQAQLARLAKERKEDPQLFILRYANERLLYRLSVSPHAKRFVLKGAALFTVWTGRAHRASRDLDLLGFGETTEDNLRAVFAEILAMPGDDGISFDVDTLTVGRIREDQEYGGVRVTATAHLNKARIRVQIDVGFGDAITPGAVQLEFPTLLSFPAPVIRTYPRETVVAEKFEAMVSLGMGNSRMKDFFDIYWLSRTFDFDAATLSNAVHATFERRETPLPDGLPVAFTPLFTQDTMKSAQWKGFIRKSGVDDGALTLTVVCDAISTFLETPLRIMGGDHNLSARWPAGGPWPTGERPNVSDSAERMIGAHSKALGKLAR